jgi:hypothetical protein
LLGGSLVQGNIEIWAGTLEGAGVATAKFRPLLIGPQGILAPDGTVTVDGNLELSGALFIDIAGSDSASYDHVRLTGEMILQDFALISIVFDNLNYVPAAGSSFEFLTAGSVTLTPYLQFEVFGVPDDLTFELINTGASLILNVSAIPIPPAALLLASGILGLLMRHRRRHDPLPGKVA